MTSFDAVAWIRRRLNARKAGHCGTLDPDAAGVLPVCVGAATGIAGYLADSRKTYRVEAACGLLTDTLDISGAVLDRKTCAMPDRNRFESALKSFLGEGEQAPPMYSAVKVNGQKLYKLARKGVSVERSPRPITIYSLDTVLYENDRVIFDVACSKGAYIRSLCRDLGEKLGIYLCVSFLLRTSAAGLRLEDALTVDIIEKRALEGEAQSMLIPADTMLGGYPKIELSAGEYTLFMNGAAVGMEERRIGAEKGKMDVNTPVKVYGNDRFLGLGSFIIDGCGAAKLRVKKFLI